MSLTNLNANDNNDKSTNLTDENVASLLPMDLRLGMIKIVSLNFCERTVHGMCKNGFFIRKPFARSEKCKDCKVIVQREKRKELRTAHRLLKKSINQKK